MVQPGEVIYEHWDLFKKTDLIRQQAIMLRPLPKLEPDKLFSEAEKEFLCGVKSLQKGAKKFIFILKTLY